MLQWHYSLSIKCSKLGPQKKPYTFKMCMIFVKSKDLKTTYAQSKLSSSTLY